MKRFILITLLLLFLGPLNGRAQERHLVRLGMGDWLFEALAFHPTDKTSDYAYTGHYFADYQYYLTDLLSVGAQADIQGIFWTETQDKRRSRNYDLTLMPTVRFTWLHTPWVRLYSGMGAGVLFAFDNDRSLEVAPAFDFKPIGIQLGKTHWCGSLDFGFMASMKNVNHIYFFGSRLVSVSVNYRW